MATQQEIDYVFGVLVRTYQGTAGRLEEDVMDQMLQTYELFLGDVDAQALQAGAVWHVKHSKWFPTIAELCEAADRADPTAKYRRDAEWLETYYENQRLRQLEEAKERRQLRG